MAEMLIDVGGAGPFPQKGRKSSGATLTEDSVSGVVPMPAADTAYKAGGRIAIKCTAGGNVQLTFADGSTDTFPVSVGLTILPFRVIEWNAAGTTATATFSNLI